MKVVLYGASGMIGSRILRELVSRGHAVTAVVRNPEKVAAGPGVTVVRGDVLDPASIAATAAGQDAAISAYAPPAEAIESLVTATRNLAGALPAAGVRRFLMVGGAGSLQVAPGVIFYEHPDFPAAWQPYARKHGEALQALRGFDLDWTSLSPAAEIAPGERTGRFRLGTEQLVMDAEGRSRISAEDYAIALVDELEQPRHLRQRFTLGYLKREGEPLRS